MIEIKHLTKSFEDKTVLKDINVTFETGKTNLIIGQSGSGKTVLMKNLVGLLSPTEGEVLYDGRNFVTMKKHDRDISGFCTVRFANSARKRPFSARYVLKYDRP